MTEPLIPYRFFHLTEPVEFTLDENDDLVLIEDEERQEPVPEEIPWNRVTFGDGTIGWLRPCGSMNRLVTPADGHVICWHSDAEPCTRQHETVITYYVELDTEGSP